MPSKRKSRRTHIFQRTTRASRARVKKAPKGNHVQSEETEAHDESVDENLHQDRQVDEQVDENEENTVNTVSLILVSRIFIKLYLKKH